MSQIHIGDCLEVLRTMPDESVHCCVTSPPYWGLRDYGVDGQLGLEKSPEEYVARMVDVFREVRRVLRDDGTLWLNLGDSYNTAGTRQGNGHGGIHGDKEGTVHRAGYRGACAGLKQKDLVGIPWRLAFALQSDGWYLRQDIIWHKPNPMPESVRDRCTKAHEYVFLMSKSASYYYDASSIKEDCVRPDEGQRATPAVFGGRDKFAEAKKQSRLHSGNEYLGTSDGKRNRRSVWTISTKPFKGAHFATFPVDLVEPCILAGCPEGGTVLDPFFGAGTVGLVAKRLGREFVGIELNPEYVAIAEKRIASDAPKNVKPKHSPLGVQTSFLQ